MTTKTSAAAFDSIKELKLPTPLERLEKLIEDEDFAEQPPPPLQPKKVTAMPEPVRQSGSDDAMPAADPPQGVRIIPDLLSVIFGWRAPYAVGKAIEHLASALHIHKGGGENGTEYHLRRAAWWLVQEASQIEGQRK